VAPGFSDRGLPVTGFEVLNRIPNHSTVYPRAMRPRAARSTKADPVRVVFTARSGPAVSVSLVDLGNRFRMILSEVEVVPSH